jgi:antirestriction protein ArdC
MNAAGMGVALLRAAAGIEQETIEQSAVHIIEWRKCLSEVKKLVVAAAGAAQLAADWIIGAR